MENILSHQPNDPFEKNQRRTNRREKPANVHTFAGIPAIRTEASAFLRLEHAPEPLARIGVQLSGALFRDSIFLDKGAIQRVAAPVLGKTARMFHDFGAGVTYSALRLSEEDAEILVLGENVLSKANRMRFFSDFDACIQRAADELKIIAGLAEMPAEQFSQAWFRDGIRPCEHFLPALRSTCDLGRALAKHGAFLTIDGHTIDMPACNTLKTVKRAGVLGAVVGRLIGLHEQPGKVTMQLHGSAKIVSLQAIGNSFVEELSDGLKLGDSIRVSFEPVIDLLQPFQPIPSKGRLLEIEAV